MHPAHLISRLAMGLPGRCEPREVIRPKIHEKSLDVFSSAGLKRLFHSEKIKSVLQRIRIPTRRKPNEKAK
jgi:hypothetical protein